MTSLCSIDKLKASGSLPSPKGAALQALRLCEKDDATNQDTVSARALN